jgi:hypothetical protein
MNINVAKTMLLNLLTRETLACQWLGPLRGTNLKKKKQWTAKKHPPSPNYLNIILLNARGFRFIVYWLLRFLFAGLRHFETPKVWRWRFYRNQAAKCKKEKLFVNIIWPIIIVVLSFLRAEMVSFPDTGFCLILSFIYTPR